jgi:hypothetical protein
MQLNQSPNQPRKIDHLELSEEHYNQILAHLSNAPYKHAAPILDLMTKATTVVFQDQLGRPNPDGPGVPRGRIVDKPEEDDEPVNQELAEAMQAEAGKRKHVPIMTLEECADAEQKDAADGTDDEIPGKSDAGGAQ